MHVDRGSKRSFCRLRHAQKTVHPMDAFVQSTIQSVELSCFIETAATAATLSYMSYEYPRNTEIQTPVRIHTYYGCIRQFTDARRSRFDPFAD